MGVHTSGVAAVGWVPVALDDSFHGGWDWLGGGEGEEGEDGHEGDEDDVCGVHGEILVLFWLDVEVLRSVLLMNRKES
jgi:hypothetical protein